jgi:hypothetical protein
MTDDTALSELLSKIRQRADTNAYFFDKIDNVRWIRVLRDEGFFQDPIEVEQLQNGYVRFPVWPESRALARVAGQDENLVMEVILACRETDNPRVHEDFVEAALQMSPATGARLIPRIAEWLRKPYPLLLPLKAGKLLARVAGASLSEEATALAKQLLQLDQVEGPAVAGGTMAIRPSFHAYFGDWEDKTILEEDVPPFVRSIGLPALEALCGLIHDVLRIESEPFGGPPNDASYIWRPSIANDEDVDREPKDFLVTAIRDAADLLVANGQATLGDVVALFERQGWQIFDRLAMHVATAYAERAPAESVRLLLRRDLFVSYQVSHEYSSLIASALSLAPEDDRAKWLSWIAAGPDQGEYVEKRRELGAEPDSEELTERAEKWRWDRMAFAPVAVLDEESRRMRDDLADRFEQPSSRPFATFTVVGSVSPLGEEEAATMSMSELAQYASSVRPTERRFDSPEEGLASVLQVQARVRPAEASQALGRFEALKPLYMRSLISGLGEAARAGSSDISWREVLAMARWLLDQPREVEGGSGGTYSDLDPGWVWTITALADLLEDGLERRLLPGELRAETWAILTALIVEPEQASVDPEDPGTASLNTIRGKAMHGIVLYADWVYELNRSDEPAPRDFSQNTPEVVDVLDAALDPDIQDSLAVRAVFGMRVAYLMKLDPDWLRSRAPRIFSTDASGQFDRLGRAAWSSYLKYSRTFLDVMALLRPQYETAVGSIPTEDGDAAVDLQMRLAEHLMVMYWHGRLGETPFEDPLLSEFWRVAERKVRKRALEFVGHSLRDGELGDDARDRLIRLWDDYARRRNESGSDLSELQAFGWWATASAFEFSWTIPRTIEVLETARGIDSPGEILATLAQAPREVLGSAVKALRLIVANDRDGWAILGHADDARALLRAAFEHDDRETLKEAKATADILIARGFLEFRKLVD